MDNNQNIILDTDLTLLKKPRRRRDFLPWWMKGFAWLFLIMGAFAPIAIIFDFLGRTVMLSIYGIESIDALSTSGLIIIAIMLFKGITAYGLWTEKDWAINIGLVDAVSGILICTILMFVNPFSKDVNTIQFTFRFELLILIPYLIKLNIIKPAWKKLAKVKGL